jgi:hypothetical protein
MRMLCRLGGQYQDCRRWAGQPRETGISEHQSTFPKFPVTSGRASPLGNDRSRTAAGGPTCQLTAEALETLLGPGSKRTYDAVTARIRPPRAVMPERSSQLGDQRQDVREHFPRHGDLGHSEGDVTPFVRDAAKRSSVRAVATARCKTSLAVNHFSPASFTGNDDLRQRETRTRKQQCHLLTSSGSRDRKSSSPFRIAQRACCSPRHEAVAARLSARVPNYDRHPLHAGSFQSGPALLSTPMSDRGALRHVR